MTTTPGTTGDTSLFSKSKWKILPIYLPEDESSTEGDLASSVVVLLRCSHSAQFVPPANTLITPVLDRDDGGDLSAGRGPRKESGPRKFRQCAKW